MTNPDRRLLWVNHFAITPDEGGGTRHFELGRELVRLGWNVSIAASDFNNKERRYTRRSSEDIQELIREPLDGPEFLWLWSAPFSKNDWRRARNWLTFSGGVRSLEREGQRPQVVIGSSPHLFAALAAQRLARRLGVPFIFEIRDLWPESLTAAGGRKGPFYYALRAIAEHLYRSSDGFIALAKGTKTHLVDRGISAESICYVPNGVDLRSFAACGAQPRDEFVAGYAGAHGPANGLDTVLEAAHLLKEERRIRFMLVGDGPEKARLMKRAQDLGLENVEFRDPMPKSRIPEFLGSLDVGLMILRDSPLFRYGVSPNKLFDYFGAQLPVVSNVHGEVGDIVTNAGAGWLTKDSSPDSLAQAIRNMAELSGDRRREMGESGRAWVAAHHSREILAERLDSFLTRYVRR